jgi:hypothetical protein
MYRRRTLVLLAFSLLSLVTNCPGDPPSPLTPPPEPDSDLPSFDPSVTIPELKSVDPVDYVTRHFQADGVTTLLGLPRYVQIVGDRRNVVGCVPGLGPHAGEYVIVGAHDASGAAVVMALAHLAEQQAPRPRTIVFCFFTSQDNDFAGASFFVSHPTLWMQNVVGMIDVDRVDRLKSNTVYIGGQDTGRDLDSIVQHATTGWPVNYQPAPAELGGRGALGPGDQKAFARKNIPALFVSGGISGDAGEVNYPAVAQVIALSDRLVDSLATMPADQRDRPAPVAVATRAPPPPPPTPAPVAPPQPDPVVTTRPAAIALAPPAGPLGVIPDDAIGNVGVLVEGIRPGTPAEQSGLQPGDLIVQFNQTAVNSLADLAACMAGARGGDQVLLVVRRGSQVLQLHATLTKR